MADKIVVMRDGRVEQVGAPLDLYDRPANTFVAGFIGSPSMNFVQGRVEGDGFVTGDGLRLPLPAGIGVVPSGEATYGVRPEHVRIGEGGVPIRVEVVEPTGSEVMVAGKLGDQPISCLFRERLALRPGEIVPVHIEPKASHLFDRADGRRLGGEARV